MPQLSYSFTENNPIADSANWKYFFPLKDKDSSPVLLLPDFLPTEEFAKLRSAVNTAVTAENLNKAIVAAVTTSGVGQPLQHSRIDDVRTTKIMPVQPGILDANKSRIQEAIKNYWTVESVVDTVHAWQCLLYEVGGHYRWHSDAFNLKEGKWHLYYPKRSFALVFCMSDWIHGYPRVDQFSGGELVFTHIVDQYNNRLTVYPKANTLVIFPTTFHYMHQVNQVREGRRVTFVNWWGDPNA
jgi:predicted 2-oxoglutarate/Fe(II)-dependent dioxygenase YbiX